MALEDRSELPVPGQESWHRVGTSSWAVSGGGLGSGTGMPEEEAALKSLPRRPGPRADHLEREWPQKHLLGRDAPEVLLGFLDTAQVFQTQTFQQLHQALIIH